MGTETLYGIELVKLFGEGKIPAPGIAKLMAMKFLSCSDGQVSMSVRADKRHLNPYSLVAGGFSSTVMDASIAMAIQTKLGPGRGLVTIDFGIKFISSIPVNIDLIVEAKIISMTKRLGFGESIIFDSDDKIYAHATATCSITKSVIT